MLSKRGRMPEGGRSIARPMTHVLIVDDEPESRERLRALLLEHGHAVSEASNGLDALEVARQQPPDLVISDILMPQMDGFALCRAYRADPRLARAPFVFYTDSYATAKDAAFARRLGATRFLVKSMAAEEVIRAITDAMKEQQAAGPEFVPHETESYRLYNESLIQRLEHRNLELADEVRGLREGESQLRALTTALDQLPAIVSLTDTHGRIEYVNRRFEEATGFTREQVRGQTHSVLRASHGDAGQGFEIRAAVLGGQEWRGEVEHRRRDGSSYWERAVISPVYNDAGAVSHFLRIAEDITEQKRALEERVQDDEVRQRRDSGEAVGRLAGGVAHDFNNLLTIVVGHSHLVLQQLAPTDPLREDLTAVLEAAQRGATITRQLLTYARRDVVHPLVVDPAQAIAALSRRLQRLAGDEVRLGFSLGPGIWPVLIDPAQFDQMVVHLVANARDAIRGTGAIDVSLANLSLTASGAATRGGLRPGEYVALRISDTGGGIAPAALPRIFEPFFTTKQPGAGTGLGLSSVVGAVEQAGGRVEVERTGPDGTTFVVLLPRSTALVDLVQRAATEDALEGTERILLVEDEPAVLELVRRTLEGYGYTVLHASTPDRALRAIHERGVHSVDLLLTDVVMPGMSGRDLATHLRGMLPHLRVLFMSGYSSDVVAEQGLLSSDESLITKPFSPTALAARVRALLDARPTRGHA
jgi:two-component system cell cycle sensor histidine kinase/response regulator CckA